MSILNNKYVVIGLVAIAAYALVAAFQQNVYRLPGKAGAVLPG